MALFALTTRQFTQGPQVAKFEEEFAEWLGAKYAVFVSSGSTANLLLVASIIEHHEIPKGAKVLVPATTWVTNVNPIFQLGLTPIFCDINLNDYSFDIEHMKKLAVEHPDIAMVFTTHLLGIPAPVDEYKKILPQAYFIDDVCEAQGSIDEYGNKIGAASTGATFSFYFGHHMSTVEGGMIVTNDEGLYDIMRMKRSHGMTRASRFANVYSEIYPDIDKQFLFITDGYNFRNTEMAAHLGRRQLKRIDKSVEIRRGNYELYWSLLKWYEKYFYVPEYSYGNSCFCFPFIAKDEQTKQRLVAYLKEYGVEYRPIVGGNLLKQPYLSNYKADTPNADILHKNGIYIGCNQFTTERDMDLLNTILEEIENDI